MAVMRLARFTGRPNQSPARGSATPSAAPARSWGKSLALLVRGVDQRERRRQQRHGLDGGEHGSVADRLDEPHWRFDHLVGERFQTHGKLPELVERAPPRRGA